MQLVKGISYDKIYKMTFGKNIRFISDCEFFPNFDIICKVKNIYIKNNEILFDVITSSNKKLTIGSNMKNLQFEFV